MKQSNNEKKFDKLEYNRIYNSNKRTQINIGLSVEEKQCIDDYLSSRDLSVSTYLKGLINADMIAHGEQILFEDKRRKKSDT